MKLKLSVLLSAGVWLQASAQPVGTAVVPTRKTTIAQPTAVRNTQFVGPNIPDFWVRKEMVAPPKKEEKVYSTSLPIHTALGELDWDPMMNGASWSFCALDMKTGEVIAQRNMNSSLIPASSMKTLTTSAALAVMGNDFTFKTELQYDGQISDGVLNGNLYLKTYGDPLLCATSPEYGMSYEGFVGVFTRIIKDIGIRKINGYIIGDDLILDNAVTARWLPYNANISTYNIAVAAPAETMTSLEEGGGDGGASATKQVVSVISSSADPACTIANIFRNSLNKNGISVSNPAVTQRALISLGQAPTLPRNTIYTQNSQPLSYVVQRTNQKSSNVLAEAILRALAFYTSGVTTKEQGSQAVRKYWQSKSLDMSAVSQQDGSGLSYSNYVSTYTFARLMYLIEKDKALFPVFYTSLPIAGVSGTLEKWFHGQTGVGLIHAKTGTLTRVLSYTGYAPLADGRTAAFSLVVNNYSGSPFNMRTKLTQTLSRLVEP